MQDLIYVFPSLTEVNSDSTNDNLYGEILGRESSNSISKIENLYKEDFCVIVSEPGNGKSRLLKETIFRADINGFNGFYLDLKQVKNKEVQKAITGYLELSPRLKPISNKEVNEIYDYWFSSGFILNDGTNNIICFDAFDEVSRENQYRLIDEIKKLKSDFPSTKIILSCRNYIFRKFESAFTTFPVKQIKIAPFSRRQVVEYLRECDFTDEEIRQVLEQFHSGSYFSGNLELINSPRILEIFVSIKQKEGIKNALGKSKSELLEHFIYAGLLVEDSKQNEDKNEIKKRVLEKLALTMEIYQSNTITKDELMSFFDDINSELAASFLQQVKIEDFYERSLLIPSSDGTIQFQNREFQEYLAAKEITRLSKVEQAFFDLAVEPNFKEIFPSWSSTLKYLIELTPSIQRLIFDFVFRKKSSSDYELLGNIILKNDELISGLPTDDKAAVFKHFLEAIDKGKILSHFGLAEILAQYYVEDIDLGKYYADYKSEIVANYLIKISGELLENGTLPNTDDWKRLYITNISSETCSKWLRESSIRALTKFGDVQLLRDNVNYDKEGQNIKYTLLYSFIELAPNDSSTIDLIIQSIKQDDINILPKPDFDDVTSKEGLLYLLSKFYKDRQFLNNYSHFGTDEFKLNKFFENLSRAYDNQIEEIIDKLITEEEDFFYISHNRFLTRLLELLKQKNPNYIFKLLDRVIQNGTYLKDAFRYNDRFIVLLNEQNVEAFIDKINAVPGAKELAAQLFLHFRNNTDDEKKRLFEFSKKYYSNIYARWETEWAADQLKWSDRGEEKYKEFQYKLNPKADKDTFITDLFYYYKAFRQLIDKYIQEEDKKRMEYLIREKVLQFDFSEAQITVVEGEKGTKTYYSSTHLQIFGDTISLFQEFNIPLEEYRAKLVECLPFLFSNDNCEYIFNLLPQLTDDEIDYLISFYEAERADAAIDTNVLNFLNACKKYYLIKAVPILKKFVFRDTLDYYKRLEALDTIHLLERDFLFYKSVFDSYENASNPSTRELAVRANTFMIETNNPYQESAIKWRIQKVIDYPMRQFNEEENGFADSHYYNLQQFYLVLTNVSDVKYINLYFDLLSKSIQLIKKNKGNRTHAENLWSIVISYFENLKKYNAMQYVVQLEDFIVNVGNFNEANLLYNHLNRVKSSYIRNLGKPESYGECIQKYNIIKSKQYLKVSSSFELYNLIVSVIEKDLRKWIEQEGALNLFTQYKIVSSTSNKGTKGKAQHEALMQKVLKTQFENFLYKKGLRDNEVLIRREEQMLDDTRTDFVISYGFIGQILIEIKLANNKQANNKSEAKKYKAKIKKYIDGTRSDFGIFLILQTDTKFKWESIREMLLEIYKDEENSIKVLGLNCVN